LAKRTAKPKPKPGPKANSNLWLWLILGGAVLALVIVAITANPRQPSAAATILPPTVVLPTLPSSSPTAPITPAVTTEIPTVVAAAPDPAVLVTPDPTWPYPEIPRVTLEGARAAFDSGAAVIVDTRSAESFAQSHAAGAINIPVNEMEALYTQLDPNQWIIPYCT